MFNFFFLETCRGTALTGRFATTVLSQKTITTSVGEFESSIGDQDSTVEDQRDCSNLYISAGLQRTEDTSCNSVGKTVLIHLVGQTFNLLILLCHIRQLVSIVIHQRWGVFTGDAGRSAGIFGAGLRSWGNSLLNSVASGTISYGRGLFGITSELGCRNHDCKLLSGY